MILIVKFQVSDVPAALLHVPAQRAVLAARHRRDGGRLPQEDAGGDRARHNLQRTQGLRALDLTRYFLKDLCKMGRSKDQRTLFLTSSEGKSVKDAQISLC